jgi:hypothetical protein
MELDATPSISATVSWTTLRSGLLMTSNTTSTSSSSGKVKTSDPTYEDDRWLEAEFLIPLLERQWLMLGIWPDALTVAFQWKQKKRPTPAGMKDMAAFAASIKAAGLLTDGTLLHMLATVLPDFDVDAEIAALETQASEDAAQAAAQAAEIQRMAINAMQANANDAANADQAAGNADTAAAGQNQPGQTGAQ